MHRDNTAVAARGDLRGDRSREFFDWRQVTKRHIGSGGGACRFQTLPSITVSENVGQSRRELRSISGSQALAVIQIGKRSLLSWELRQSRVTVVLQIAASERP